MTNQNIQLNIGDEIGFNIIGQGISESDRTIFFPVVDIIEKNGETAYIYEFPDGAISRSAITQSALIGHQVKINILPEKMLCLSDRKDEFMSALERGKNSNLEVFPDFEKDKFVVVNHEKQKEYRINLETISGKTFADCECADFQYRKRVCKHISAVLTDTVFGLSAKV